MPTFAHAVRSGYAPFQPIQKDRQALLFAGMQIARQRLKKGI
jgi:hypothetical protein